MRCTLLLFLFLALALTSCASLEETAKRAREEVENQLGNTQDEADQEDATTNRAQATTSDDFVAGRTPLFRSDFAETPVGDMPEAWKSNGAGQVVRFPEATGRWLLLSERTTYKLDSLLTLPRTFTVEFDVLTRSDQAADLNAFYFGFAHDNSVRPYIKSTNYGGNALTNTRIRYFMSDVRNSSRDTGITNSQDYDLAGYANALMHVAIAVDGQNMKVYLDETKVLDAKMFDAESAKYFYLSSGSNMENEAQLAVGHFVIAR